MKNNAPVIVNQSVVFKLRDKFPFTKPKSNPEMVEFEEAKQHFENQFDWEAFWAGRLLAGRRSTRIAA